MIEKPWHHDWMTDTVYVRPWFFGAGMFSLGFLIGALLAHG